MVIGPIEGNFPATGPTGVSPSDFEGQGGAKASGSFEDLLGQAVLDTNQRIVQATEAGHAFASGKTDDIHGTMLALSEADISLKFLGNVRNKVIDAFYELWRMSI